MKPYYQDQWATIYHGDCKKIMPRLKDINAIVTDPPYGVGFKYATYDDSREAWIQLMNKCVPLMRKIAPFVIMPGGGHDRIGWWYNNHKPDWIICWYKGSPGHLSKIGFNDWEMMLVWGKRPKPMHDHFQTACGFHDTDGHPCPKPIAWAVWLCKRAALPEQTILDPFMGSGTTLIAAKNLKRYSIGIEMEEKYCELAATRLARGEKIGNIKTGMENIKRMQTGFGL